jgi:hypothetical protein
VIELSFVAHAEGTLVHALGFSSGNWRPAGPRRSQEQEETRNKKEEEREKLTFWQMGD